MVTPWLTAAEMDAIGDELAGGRPDSCAFTRPSGDLDAAGNPAGTYTAVATVACRVDSPGRQAIERVFGARFGPEADYVVSVERGTDVNPDYRITVNGQTFEVIYAPEAASFSFELAVLCRASS